MDNNDLGLNPNHLQEKKQMYEARGLEVSSHQQ